MTPVSPPADEDRPSAAATGEIDAYLAAVEPATRREDAEAVLALMREVTGVEPVLWSGSTVGFGRQPYTTADSKEHEWFALGLAPRTPA